MQEVVRPTLEGAQATLQRRKSQMTFADHARFVARSAQVASRKLEDWAHHHAHNISSAYDGKHDALSLYPPMSREYAEFGKGVLTVVSVAGRAAVFIAPEVAKAGRETARGVAKSTRELVVPPASIRRVKGLK